MVAVSCKLTLGPSELHDNKNLFMKIIITIFALIGLNCLENAHYPSEKFNINGVEKSRTDTTQKFEIVKIDSIKSTYLIYARRNDSIIKIASKKEQVSGCKTIIKGMSYNLEVESLLKETAGKLHMGGVRVENHLIRLEGGKVVWDLFVTNNLKGLCYINGKDTEK